MVPLSFPREKNCIAESQNILCSQEAKVSLPSFPLCPCTTAQLSVPWDCWWCWKTHPPSVSGFCILYLICVEPNWLVFQLVVYQQKLFFICFLYFLCVPSLAQADFLLLWSLNTNPISPYSWKWWFLSSLPLGASPSSHLVYDSSDAAAVFQPQEQSLISQQQAMSRRRQRMKMQSSEAQEPWPHNQARSCKHMVLLQPVPVIAAVICSLLASCMLCKSTAKPDPRACKVKNRRNLICIFAMLALIVILMQSKSREREPGDNFSWSPSSWVLNNWSYQDIRIRLQPCPAEAWGSHANAGSYSIWLKESLLQRDARKGYFYFFPKLFRPLFLYRALLHLCKLHSLPVPLEKGVLSIHAPLLFFFFFACFDIPNRPKPTAKIHCSLDLSTVES